MINITLRSWQKVDAALVRGQLSYGPNHQLRIFNLTTGLGIFSKADAFVKADRIPQQGLILRAFTALEFREHFINKIESGLAPMGEALTKTLSQVLRHNPRYEVARKSMDPKAEGYLRAFAADLFTAEAYGNNEHLDPAASLYALLLGDKTEDWYVTELGGVEVSGDPAMPADYPMYRSAEMIPRIVIAHHYRVPLQSPSVQRMLAYLRTDNVLDQYNLFQ